MILDWLKTYALAIVTVGAIAGWGAAGVQTLRAANEKSSHGETRVAFAEHRTLAERASRVQTENFMAKASAWRKAQQENADADRIVQDELLGDLAAERASRSSLQQYTDGLAAAAGQATRDPEAQPSGQTAKEAADLLAYVSGRINEAAGGIGEFAERAHGAGTLCERDYDSLNDAP